MNQLNEEQLQVHVPIVGWLFVIGNVLLFAIGAFVFILLTGVGVAVRDTQALTILSIVGTSVGVFLVVLGIPGLIAGFGLLARQAWARILTIVVAILGLINFPIGTLIGIYAIWVLLQDSANTYFTSPRPRLETAPKPAL